MTRRWQRERTPARWIGSLRQRSLALRFDLLLSALVIAQLLIPTAAPLEFDGVPLNSRAEYLAASGLILWIGLLVARRILAATLPPSAKSPAGLQSPGRWLAGIGIALGVALLLVRLTSPGNERIQACYATPERPEIPCLFSADGWWWTRGQDLPTLTNLEDRIDFDPQQQRPWRLGIFNDLAFNLYGSAPGSRNERREAFRRNVAHPFSVTFAWDEQSGERLARRYPNGALLHVTYRGEARILTGEGSQTLPFSATEREGFVPLSTEALATLRLHYANFTCTDALCLDELTMVPVAMDQAVFRVELASHNANPAAFEVLDNRMLGGDVSQAPWLLIGQVLEWALLAVVVMRVALVALEMARQSLASGTGAMISLGMVSLTIVIFAWVANVYALLLLVLVLPVFTIAIGIVRPRAWTQSRHSDLRMLVPGLLLILTATILAIPAVDRGSDALPPAMGAWSIAGASHDTSPLLAVGQDPLTYASWSKGLLDAPQRFLDPSIVISKPFYLHVRAVLYAIFGDGERYSTMLSRQLLWWTLGVCGIGLVATLGRPTSRSDSPGKRIGELALAGIALTTWAWLAFSLLMFSIRPAFYAGWLLTAQFSEGPAVTAALLSFGILFVGVSRRHWPTLVLAGLILGLAVGLRTSSLALAAIGLAVIGFASDWARQALRLMLAYVFPLGGALVAIWAHAGFPLGYPAGVKEYVTYNTGPAFAREHPGSYLGGVVPGDGELWALLAALLALLIGIASQPCLRRKAQLLVLGVAVVLGAFLPIRAQVNVGYWPRPLLIGYYIIALVPVMVLLLTRLNTPPTPDCADEPRGVHPSLSP